MIYRKLMLCALVSLWLSACTGDAEPTEQAKEVVQTEATTVSVEQVVAVTGGTIRGNLREGGLQEYLGIPYAAPPTDDLRWQPPGPVIAWDGERDATEFGLPCYQPGSLSAFYDRSYTEMSEDCLTLNVWTRANDTADALPVMVWVHGGALVMGSGTDYDGAPLTEKGVVLVTINYRLGPLGFFAHPELSEEGGGASGNQGFRDQIAALQWVQENIERFGGDPDNVTIFGESAGSWSMSVLQASPLAEGLFSKVIGQSGARFIPLPDLTTERWGLPSGEGWGETLASVFAGEDAADLATLRGLSADSILAAYASDPSVLLDFDRLTIVDGAVLPDEVNTIFAEGKQADVPVLIGSNADEATTFDPGLGASEPVDYEGLLNQFVAATLGGDTTEIMTLYPDTSDAARSSYIQFNTDAMFTQPMRLWANYMEGVSSPAYLYWWNWRPMIDGSDEYGAFHAAEIPYVFGDLGMFGIEESEREADFSETMMTLWTNFAKHGNPSGDSIIEWPAYTEDKPSTAVLGATIEVTEGVRSTEVELITAGYVARRQ